jgi:putative alpha-1,2-mannosidase
MILALGASSMAYVKSLRLNGVVIDKPVVLHQQIMEGGELVFEMADTPQAWASTTLSRQH